MAQRAVSGIRAGAGFGGATDGASRGRPASPGSVGAVAASVLGDGVAEELDVLDLESHAQHLAALLGASGGAGEGAAGAGAPDAGGDGASTGAAIHPALVLLNHRFLSEVQRHERALEALRLARGGEEAEPDVTTSLVEFHYGAQGAYATPPAAGAGAGPGSGAGAGATGRSPGTAPPSSSRSAARVARQSTGSQESLFFMAALQLLEARADARRGMLRGDGGVGSDGMSDAGTDDDGGGMPSFASPSPVSRRSDDNSSSDVVMTGYLSKHSDFHWKSKWVVVRYGEMSYASGPNAAARRFKRICLDPQSVVQAVNSGNRRTNFVITNLLQRGSKRTWRAKSEQERQRWIDALLLASQSRTARADESLWSECTRVYKCVQAAQSRDAYVRMVWAQLQGRRLVVPVSWVNEQLHRTRAGAGRATLDQMLKDMQRDSLWVNGKRVTGADGVTHPVGALTRAIFQFGLRSGILTEEWQALELAYEVLINTTRTTCGGDSYDAVSHMLTVPMLMILCPLSQDAHPLRYSISLDQPSLEAQHAGATAIPASVEDPAHGAYDEVMHGAHPLHANRVGLAVHRKALTMGADSTPGQQGTPANAQTKRKLFVQFETQMAYKIVDTDPQDTESATWATVTVTMRRVFIYYNNTATALDEGVAVIEAQLSPYYRGKFATPVPAAESSPPDSGSHRRSHSTPLGWAVGLLSHMGHASRELDADDTPDDTESERGSTAIARGTGGSSLAPPVRSLRKERGESVSSALSSVSSTTGAHGGLALSPVVRPVSAPAPSGARPLLEVPPLPPPAPRSTVASDVGAMPHEDVGAGATPTGLGDGEDWELVHAQVDQAGDATHRPAPRPDLPQTTAPPVATPATPSARHPSNGVSLSDQTGSGAGAAPTDRGVPSGESGAGAGTPTAPAAPEAVMVAPARQEAPVGGGDEAPDVLTTHSASDGARHDEADPSATFMRDVQARLKRMGPPPPPARQSGRQPAVPPGARSGGMRKSSGEKGAGTRRAVPSPKASRPRQSVHGSPRAARTGRSLQAARGRGLRDRSPLATSHSPRFASAANQRWSPKRGVRQAPRGAGLPASKPQPRDTTTTSGRRNAPASSGSAGGRLLAGTGDTRTRQSGASQHKPAEVRSTLLAQRRSHRRGHSSHRSDDDDELVV